MTPTIIDHGYVNMVYPKVVGQSGTANPAPVLVTRPPARIKRNVAPAVTKASRCGHALGAPARRRRSETTGSMGPIPLVGQRRLRRPGLVLGEVVSGDARRAVLVRAPVHDRRCLPPVPVGRRG